MNDGRCNQDRARTHAPFSQVELLDPVGRSYSLAISPDSQPAGRWYPAGMALALWAMRMPCSRRSQNQSCSRKWDRLAWLDAVLRARALRFLNQAVDLIPMDHHQLAYLVVCDSTAISPTPKAPNRNTQNLGRVLDRQKLGFKLHIGCHGCIVHQDGFVVYTIRKRLFKCDFYRLI